MIIVQKLKVIIDHLFHSVLSTFLQTQEYIFLVIEEAKQISINGETIQKLNYLNNIKEESKLCPFQNPNASNLEGDDGQPKNNIAITESFTEEKSNILSIILKQS